MKTILLVDDEYGLVEMLGELLEGEGYRVVFANNGKEGLERARAEHPDLVITDLMMPVANGRVLVRGLKATPELRSVPVALMSASTCESALADGDGAVEVATFLRKPISWEQVREAVMALIGPAAA